MDILVEAETLLYQFVYDDIGLEWLRLGQYRKPRFSHCNIPVTIGGPITEG